MNIKDTFTVICSFLSPLELTKCRRLSNDLKKWTTEFLLKTYETIHIEKYACPICANLIDQRDISKDTYFNDYFLTDHQKEQRIQKVNESFNEKNIFKVIRKNLLCDDCEIIEDYDFIYFRYKGSRKYNLISYYGLFNWASLCMIEGEKGYWNEYRKMLSSSSYGEIVNIEEDYGNNYNTYNYNTYEDEEDDEDNE
jgi:hypothetical protein